MGSSQMDSAQMNSPQMHEFCGVLKVCAVGKRRHATQVY